MKHVSLDSASGKDWTSLNRVTIKDGKITAVRVIERHETA